MLKFKLAKVDFDEGKGYLSTQVMGTFGYVSPVMIGPSSYNQRGIYDGCQVSSPSKNTINSVESVWLQLYIPYIK